MIPIYSTIPDQDPGVSENSLKKTANQSHLYILLYKIKNLASAKIH